MSDYTMKTNKSFDELSDLYGDRGTLITRAAKYPNVEEGDTFDILTNAGEKWGTGFAYGFEADRANGTILIIEMD